MKTLAIGALCLALVSCSEKQNPAPRNSAPSNPSNEQGLFLTWQNPTSKRTAILEERNGMVWLYLSAPGTHSPERDSPVCSTIPLADKVDWKAAAESGVPPVLAKNVASSEAVATGLMAEQFKVIWSADGQSVALLRTRRCIAMIVAGIEFGHSRAIAVKSPLGLPFDQKLAEATFQLPSL